MNCLITGANGFVGGYLAEHLLGKDHKVTGTIYPKNAVRNISHILNKIKTYACDLTSPIEIETVIQKTLPDYIFHLAGQGNVPLSWEDPAGTFNINVMGTLNLLTAVKKYSKKAKILIICSGDEYDFSDSNKTINEETALSPQNPYALSKMCADLASEQFGKYNNLHVIRVRPFPHIGPRQTPNFVISDFCRQIALIENKKQPPVLNTGNLESKRDFTDVRDMVTAYSMAIEKCKGGEVYNISSGKFYSIKELVDKLLKLTNISIRIETDPVRIRPKDTEMKRSSNQKFRDITGWEPKIPIEQTLTDTLNYWRKNI